jgi:hypothetical protein
MPFKFVSSISPTIAFNKDAFPNRRHSSAGRTKSFACQNQPKSRAKPSPVQTSLAWASLV